SAAGSAVTNLDVTATVSQRCTITTTPVAFGSYDPVVDNSAAGVDKTATGAVSLTCTKGSANITGTLSNGTHFATTGRMSGGGDFLSYELYQPVGAAPGTCPGTQRWGTTGAEIYPAVATWSALSPVPFNVCGVVPKGQDVTGSSGAGTSYTDT